MKTIRTLVIRFEKVYLDTFIEVVGSNPSKFICVFFNGNPNKIYDFDPKATLVCDASLWFKIIESNGFNALALKVL